MIYSMTGYGRAYQETPERNTTIEIKSVNNRYLEVSVRLPRFIGYLEEKIKKYVNQRGISRGKIDINISIDIISTEGVEIEINKAYVESYLKALQKLGEEYSLRNDISIMQIARNQEIFSIKKPIEDENEEWLKLKPVLDEAIDKYIEARGCEGERLKNDILSKKQNLIELYNKIEPLSKDDVQSQYEKLKERLSLIIPAGQIDENRLITECAIMADRLAIDEELVRLSSHFVQFDNILSSNEPVGRKLDFLLQEINRETNTIGSKVNNSDIAKIVVEMKSELEKIREQIQNIE